jgi:type I restriction enzyme, R subunit
VAKPGPAQPHAAIARVNRVYGDKPGGLIVDLIRFADQVVDALATYTQAGGTGEAIRQVQDEAVPAMQAASRSCRASSTSANTV